MSKEDYKKFIYFLLDEFINEIDVDKYYNKYENMDKDSLYFYFKGKFDEQVRGVLDE